VARDEIKLSDFVVQIRRKHLIGS